MSVLHDLSQEVLSVLTEKGVSSFSYILSESEKNFLEILKTILSPINGIVNIINKNLDI